LAPASAAPTRESCGPAQRARPIPVRLTIDWGALGLDPGRVRCVAPAIDHFQNAASYEVGAPIPIEPGKGRIVIFKTTK